MKRIIIIGEGPTEQAFSNEVLQPHLISQGILIQNPTIKRSSGGIVPWPILKKEIENYLKSDRTAYVTTLIDYYGLNEKHDFPAWDEAHQKPDKSERMIALEDAMVMDIEESLRYRFIPNIQLHEFEGLLFSELQVFENNFSDDEFIDKPGFEAIFSEYPNPEDINNHPDTAPSKRLEKHIKDYNKPIYGSILAQEIGLPKIRIKCPRFNAWVAKLEDIQ